LAQTRSRRDRLSRQLTARSRAGIAMAPALVLAGNLVGPALVLAWAGFTRTPWARLGLARPRHGWRMAVVTGSLGGVALRLVMTSVVMPLLSGPASGSP